MTKKAQINIGQVLVGCFLFIVLIMGGFNFYFGSLYENSVSPPSGVDEANFTASFSGFNESFGDTANETYKERNKIPIIGGTLDFISAGVDAVKSSWDSVGFMGDYVQFVRKNTVLGKFLPDSFWTMLIAVMTIILTLIGIGALWRWNLTR